MLANKNGNFACVSKFYISTQFDINTQELEITESVVEKKDKCVNIDKIFLILCTYFLKILRTLLISEIQSKNGHAKTIKSNIFSVCLLNN